MTVTISIGSGKGGTGKSTITSNLALLLARTGKRVVIADLDLGGADIHIMFGEFEPAKRLTDFLLRKTNDLNELRLTLENFPSIQIIAGTGDTLQTANMSYQEKQRLFRALSQVDTDVLLIDVGAGASYHALDFFMHSDIQICATLPEPTAIMDFYTFLQLATIRKALGSFLSSSDVSANLKNHSFNSLNDVLELAENTQEGARQIAQQSLRYFHPLLITNRVVPHSKLNKMRLQKLAAKYLGISLPDLGDIPEDPMVPESTKTFLPVCEYAPNSEAAQALVKIGERLNKIIDLFISKRQKA